MKLEEIRKFHADIWLEENVSRSTYDAHVGKLLNEIDRLNTQLLMAEYLREGKNKNEI